MSEPDFAARNKLDSLLRDRTDALIKPWLVATVPIGLGALVLSTIEMFWSKHIAQIPWFVRALLGVIALGLAVLSIMEPKRRLVDKRLKAFLREPFDLLLRARKLHLSPQQTHSFTELPRAMQAAFSLTLLFEEAYKRALLLAAGPAVLGFVYGLLARTLVDAAPFLVASLALNCWHYPRLGPLMDRGHKLEAVDEDEEALRALGAMKTADDLKQTARRRTPPIKRPSRPPPTGKP